MSGFRNTALYAAPALNREMAIARYGAAGAVQRKLFRTLAAVFLYNSVVMILVLLENSRKSNFMVNYKSPIGRKLPSLNSQNQFS